MFGNKTVYLDHAATTPVNKEVIKSMQPYHLQNFHNASAIYKGGVSAKEALEKSRASIAKNISARPQEIIFTQGATEANNLAILGLVNLWRRENKGIPHLITSNIEHPSVLEVFKYLEERRLAEIDYLNVDQEGIVSAQELKKFLKENTILVSVMYANNEIGTIQPIRELAKTIRWWRKNNNIEYPYFHTDAVQAVNYLDINVEKLGVDMMTINASKIYGPKMIGALYKKTSFPLSPILHGGRQEFNLRPGTEDVGACVGLARALEITTSLRESEAKRLTELRNYFIKELEENISNLQINGSREERLPNNVNILIPNMLGEEVVLRLDAKRIYASTQSACKLEDGGVSHVIRALGKNISQDDAVIRFTMGRKTIKSDIDKTVSILKEIIKKYKNS